MHQQVWRRVAGSACRIGPQVVDPDSADVSDLADYPCPALGTLAAVRSCEQLPEVIVAVDAGHARLTSR